MAGYIPYQASLDPLGAAMGKGLGDIFTQLVTQRALKTDEDRMLEHLRNLQRAQQYGGLATGSMVGGPMGGFMGNALQPDMSNAVVPPTFKTRPMKEMMLNLQLGQLLNPMQQAQIGESQAQAEYYRAHAEALRNPLAKPMAQMPQRLKEGNEYGLPAGTVVQFNEGGDMAIRWTPPNATVNQTEYERAVELLGDTERFGALTPDQRRAVRYKAGLESRPTTPDNVQSDLSRWLGIYRNARYDPTWGQEIPELVGVAAAAEKKIGELTARLRSGPGAKPISRGEFIRELRQFKIGDKPITDRVPLATLVTKYPALSLQFPTLSETELDEVLSAIEAGMTEGEILKYFGGGNQNAAR